MRDKTIPDFIYLGIEGSGREESTAQQSGHFPGENSPRFLSLYLWRALTLQGRGLTAPLVPDEELFAPSGFIQCSFFKLLAHGTHNAHSVGKELESKTQPSCAQFNQFTRGPGVTLGSPTIRDRTETPGLQSTCAGGKYGNDFQEMIIIWMFIPGKSMDMYVKCNINQELCLYSAVRIFWR